MITKHFKMSEKDILPKADGKTELESTKNIDQNPKEESTEVLQEVSNKSKVEEDDHGVNEIEESNAEDAEDEGNKDRHKIEVKDYHAMTMEDLVDEFTNLVDKEKVQAIRSHIDTIKKEFNEKFGHFLDEKKEEFTSSGGNPIDFHFSSPVKKRFNNAFKDYKTKLRTHYKNIESNLKENLTKKLEII